MPDAATLERLVGALNASEAGSVLDTLESPGRVAIEVKPESIVGSLEVMRSAGYQFLASVHGIDYYPNEPRLGVDYEMLSREALDRVALTLRVSIEDPHVPSVTPAWPCANFQEREAFDMFGLIFDGHPDLRRILMPEDYEGYPQRRDFPIGGEPILFTHNEHNVPRWFE
ncbi:MAG: NADH-quinone oxidoreductase subunit C [Actinobacteria bacterium]|uniref:Unannotated protein n=1 Tax=freshwater metagenome TaxID=449393 RepID=A0A6J5ZXI0_9ZZZZ|nr:NADH-quinone oxidoreductase subunit C [Actinomycetota bacterium]